VAIRPRAASMKSCSAILERWPSSITAWRTRCTGWVCRCWRGSSPNSLTPPPVSTSTPGARIGGSFFIDHGTGVVIGETAVIGERVRLYQAVTLGAKRFSVDADGALEKGTPRHPIVEDDVVIYAGATILGRVTIGRGSSIGGNVWLTHSIPPGSFLTQAVSRNEMLESGGGI
jgi:acetyltransferase-like isoleucine patch superfamily enzyme